MVYTRLYFIGGVANLTVTPLVAASLDANAKSVFGC